jgi:hypothetical protein
MQIPAAQTSLEQHPHRADRARPRAVREPNAGSVGSRFASEPHRVQRLEDLTPQTPTLKYNKLPNMYTALAVIVFAQLVVMREPSYDDDRHSTEPSRGSSSPRT